MDRIRVFFSVYSVRIWAILSALFICLLCVETEMYNEAQENKKITDGIIYDMEIINGETRSYIRFPDVYISTRYRLYVTKEERKAYFDVSEDTYCMYSIGDWFDSQNPRKVK